MHKSLRFIRNLTLNSILFATFFLCAGNYAWGASPDLSPSLPDISAQTGFPTDELPSQDSSSATDEAGPASMLKGSVLGQLLFNQPFERASLFDIAAILLLAFILSRIISFPRSGRGEEKDEHSPWETGEEKKSGPAAPPPGFDPWGRLRSKQEKKTGKGKTLPFPGGNHSGPEAASAQEQPATQAQAQDEDDNFIKGAKLLYVRLHEAWKKQDMEFIEHFTSPHAYQQFLQEDKEDYMDIVKVDAKVTQESTRNGEPFVTVEFDALAHRAKQAGPPSEVKEIWAFLEPSSTGTWRLEEKTKA